MDGMGHFSLTVHQICLFRGNERRCSHCDSVMTLPWILAARPKTLPAALIPVVLGSALAWRDDSFQWLPAALCGLFALLIQVGTNYANDYYDFLRGADTPERIGPARMVASGRISPASMQRGMWLVFGLAFFCGCGLLPFGGWWLLPIGLLCIICGIAYTGGPYPLGYNGWGEVFVFLFFGLVAVSLTYYVQAGFSVDSLILGMVPGALSTNLLVVNNYRDADTDINAGKRTLAVRWGRGFALLEYRLLLVVAALGTGILCWSLPHGFWLISLPPILFLRGWVISRQLEQAATREQYDLALTETARYLLIYGIILASLLIWGR